MQAESIRVNDVIKCSPLLTGVGRVSTIHLILMYIRGVSSCPGGITEDTRVKSIMSMQVECWQVRVYISQDITTLVAPSSDCSWSGWVSTIHLLHLRFITCWDMSMLPCISVGLHVPHGSVWLWGKTVVWEGL